MVEPNATSIGGDCFAIVKMNNKDAVAFNGSGIAPKKLNYDFFKKLKDEQNNGGSEALLQTLMEFDLNEFEVRNIPETPARLEQKMLSMGLIEKWWLEILSNEDFLVGGKILDFDAMNRVAKLDLLHSFNEHTKVLPGGNFGITDSTNCLVLLFVIALSLHLIFQL